MNIRALTLAAGIAVAGSANAGILGLEATFVSSGANGDTFRIEVVFDTAAIVVSVGDSTWVADSNFFQSPPPFAGVDVDLAANSAFFGIDPNLAFDTWVTIGTPDSITGNVRLTTVGQNIPQVDMRPGIGGVGRDGFFVLVDGLVDQSSRAQYIAQGKQGVGRARCEADGLAQAAGGVLISP